jgi:hypothetical protein
MEIDDFGDLSIDGRIILNKSSRNIEGRRVLDLTGSG